MRDITVALRVRDLLIAAVSETSRDNGCTMSLECKREIFLVRSALTEAYPWLTCVSAMATYLPR